MAPHRPLRRVALGPDFLPCSPYKFFGPHLGIAAIRPDLAASLPADRVRPPSEDPPGHRFETGTQSHEAIAGARSRRSSTCARSATATWTLVFALIDETRRS